MKIEILDGNLLKKAFTGSAKCLEDNKEEINSLNVFPVPDGDTGTNMSLTMRSALKQGLTVEENSASKVALATSQGSLMGARGNSGVILSQIFRGFAVGLDGKDTIDTRALAEGLKQAADTAYKAVMKPTEGTILTVARECGEYALTIYKTEKDILQFFEKVIAHGNIVLDKTPDMLPVLKQAGVVDAGGKGYLCVLLGAYNALAGIEASYEEAEQEETKFQEVVEHKHLKMEEIKYGYCTEFMIDTDYSDLDSFRDQLAVQGDSLMVVGGEGLIKVHIHTNNPGLALEKALAIGQLKDIKIDNMRIQNQEVLLKAELEEKAKSKKEKKKYSFVAISIGEGIDEVFKGLNVDVLVSGGQTMNPSTEDILNAIEDANGENVFILPNNGNIILAAEQARELSDKNIIVIPTKTIPQGISALLTFNEESSPDENKATMMDAISYVRTGEVTYSVRDTEFNNTKLKKDDIIGIAEGDIVSNGKDINEVSIKLLEKMIDEDISLITIIYGLDLEESKADELEEYLSDKYEDMDIEVVYGGQPLYYYIFSLE